ncbi:MAG: cytochrome c oxidase assembly protein [Hyphomicrobiaceae bacterium]
MSKSGGNDRGMGQRHSRLALSLALVAVGMLGMAYAAVPLYRLVCQVTGFGGTTQRADAAPGQIVDRTVTIRFDANVANGLSWRFAPDVTSVDVKLGENKLAFFKASNPTAAPLSGVATFNVTPEIAGAYFNKIQCFCFDQQTLKAGETVEMPVSFFVDPAILEEPGGADIKEITLSYTFYPSDGPPAPKEGS